MPTTLDCDCNGRQHVVCRPLGAPITLTPCSCGGSPKHSHHVALSEPPPRPRTWDCGCHGAAHPVCDPTWKHVKDAPALVKPLRFLTLKQALREGLAVRPHVEHVVMCDCTDEEIRWRHEPRAHACLCGFVAPIAPGQTLRIPVTP